jgi:hypothetical protein
MYWMNRLEELNEISGKILGIVPNRRLIALRDTKVWDVVEIGEPNYEKSVIATANYPDVAIEKAYKALKLEQAESR